MKYKYRTLQLARVFPACTDKSSICGVYPETHEGRCQKVTRAERLKNSFQKKL